MVKKTDRYCNQTISLTQQEAVRSILNIKLQQNNDKLRELEDMVRNRLGQARLFVAGTAVDNSSEDAATRVSRGFQELVTRAYPNLRMLQGITYQESDLAKLLDNSQQTFLITDVANLSEAEQEMLALIHRNKSAGNRTTVKNILEAFEKKPYGWYYAAIICVLAKLIARGKVELRLDSNLLENPKEIDSTLRNTARQGNTIVDLCETVTEEQLRRAKAFYRDFFDTPTSANEVKTIGQDIQRAFMELKNTLDTLVVQQAQYPFVAQLRPLIDEIHAMADKPYIWFVTSMSERWNDWLTAKAETLDPIRQLMGGTQKTIYDRARDFVANNQANLADLDGDLLVAVKSTLEDPECYRGGKIQPLKSNTEKLQSQLDAQLIELREKAKDAVQEKLDQLRQSPGFEKLESEKQASLREPFLMIANQVDRQSILAVIRNQINQVNGELWTQALNKLAQLSAPPPDPGGAGEKPPIEIVPVHSIQVSVGKTVLSNEADIEQYLRALKEKMIQMLKENKQFNL
jgi:predicted transcriptional regulator